MHVVRSIVPQFLESLGYRIADAPSAGADCFVERDGRRYGALVFDRPLVGADAVELRLLGLANGFVPLAIPTGPMTLESQRWLARFGIPFVERGEVLAFEARIAAEEEILAEERLWALEHADAPAIAPPAPPAPPARPLGPEIPVEIPLALPAPAVFPLLPSPPVVADPYPVDALLVLRKSELVEIVRRRLEEAADTLLALPWPELLPVATASPVLAVPAPPTPLVPERDLYTLAGLWVGAAGDRLHAEALALEAAGEALAALPWPTLVEPAALPVEEPALAVPLEPLAALPLEEPLLALPVEAAPEILPLAAWVEAATPEAAPAEDVLPWPVAEAPSEAPAPAEVEALPWTPAPVAEAPVAEAAPAEVPAELPWGAEAAAPVEAAAPEPVDAGTDALPWDVTARHDEPEDAAVAVRRAHIEAMLHTRHLNRLLPAPGAEHALATADPSVWGTRNRLDGIRERLNRANVALSVAGIESEWLKSVAENGHEE